VTRERGQVPTGPARTKLNKLTQLYLHTNTVISYQIVGDRNLENWSACCFTGEIIPPTRFREQA